MADKTGIEWTDATWHEKSAAKRIGVDVSVYVGKREEGMKWCYSCKDWHKKSVFSIDRSRGDGLASSCRGRAARVEKPRATEAERRERANASYRRYYASEAGADIRARVYARKRSIAPIPSWWRAEQLQRGCAYCGMEANSLDHFIPVALGGDSHPGNLVPACQSCNSKKKHSDPMIWMGRLLPDFIDDICVRPMAGISAIELLGVV